MSIAHTKPCAVPTGSVLWKFHSQRLNPTRCYCFSQAVKLFLKASLYYALSSLDIRSLSFWHLKLNMTIEEVECLIFRDFRNLTHKRVYRLLYFVVSRSVFYTIRNCKGHIVNASPITNRFPQVLRDWVTYQKLHCSWPIHNRDRYPINGVHK